MKNLSHKIELYLGRKPNFIEEVILQDDSNGQGAYIKEWNVDGVDKPTDEQLNAFESEADKIENNFKAVQNRMKEYPDLGDVIDAIFKKEAGDSTEFDDLATKRQETKTKYAKE